MKQSTYRPSKRRAPPATKRYFHLGVERSKPPPRDFLLVDDILHEAEIFHAGGAKAVNPAGELLKDGGSYPPEVMAAAHGGGAGRISNDRRLTIDELPGGEDQPTGDTSSRRQSASPQQIIVGDQQDGLAASTVLSDTAESRQHRRASSAGPVPHGHQPFPLVSYRPNANFDSARNMVERLFANKGLRGPPPPTRFVGEMERNKHFVQSTGSMDVSGQTIWRPSFGFDEGSNPSKPYKHMKDLLLFNMLNLPEMDGSFPVSSGTEDTAPALQALMLQRQHVSEKKTRARSASMAVRSKSMSAHPVHSPSRRVTVADEDLAAPADTFGGSRRPSTAGPLVAERRRSSSAMSSRPYTAVHGVSGGEGRVGSPAARKSVSQHRPSSALNVDGSPKPPLSPTPLYSPTGEGPSTPVYSRPATAAATTGSKQRRPTTAMSTSADTTFGETMLMTSPEVQRNRSASKTNQTSPYGASSRSPLPSTRPATANDKRHGIPKQHKSVNGWYKTEEEVVKAMPKPRTSDRVVRCASASYATRQRRQLQLARESAERLKNLVKEDHPNQVWVAVPNSSDHAGAD